MKELEQDRRDVKRLLAVENGLTDWEVEFAESLAEWVKSSRLTKGQRLKLDGILERLDL